MILELGEGVGTISVRNIRSRSMSNISISNSRKKLLILQNNIIFNVSSSRSNISNNIISSSRGNICKTKINSIGSSRSRNIICWTKIICKGLSRSRNNISRSNISDRIDNSSQSNFSSWSRSRRNFIQSNNIRVGLAAIFV